MKLAISRIAWSDEEEQSVLPLLTKYHVGGIEIAPSSLWPGWAGIDDRSLARVRSRYEGEGFTVPAIQAILYGKDELTLFDPACRGRLMSHMGLVADAAAGLGAAVAVFGSPRSRKRGALSGEQAWAHAVELFVELGRIFEDRDVMLGIEHCPAEYGCDFLTNVPDTESFVRAVASPAVGLHLDAGGLALSGIDGAAVIENCAVAPCHFHASQPRLEGFPPTSPFHREVGRALSRTGYRRWVSIEMRRGAETLSDIERALACVTDAYLGAGA